MTKRILVDPEQVRKPDTLELGSIPVNVYNKTIRQELDTNPDITPEACLRVYLDMAMVREFETMLDRIKTLGAYEGIPYKHPGPAHLSIGQEGAAVGEAFHLDVDDHVFGSHRSHGELVAKGMQAVRQLKGKTLLPTMKEFFEGTILKVVESGPRVASLTLSDGKLVHSDELELGIDFLLYGFLAETFGRVTGFNKGMGGSMHAFFTPFGIYPNNAIVGGSGPLAVGSALYKKIMQAPGITVANIGDASSGCGPVWESMNFASMGQFRKLWDAPFNGGLRMVFNFMDNFYGMGGQPIGETMGYERLARIGAALNPEKMHAEVVDGNNPLALAEAYKRKKQILMNGEGPVLLDVLCYRQCGHSPSDQSSYREREEIEMWRNMDPLKEFSAKLIEAGVATEGTIKEIHDYVTRKVTKACKLAIDDTISPRISMANSAGLRTLMFSNEENKKLPGLSRPSDVLMPMDQNPHVKQLAKKSRSGIGADGKPLREGKAVSYRDAIFEAIIHHFYNDSRVVAYGEENRDWDGAFAVYRGLTEALPYHRLFNSPISEAAIVGTAVGFAIEGGRPIVELMYCDFMGRAGDEIFNQLAKWQAMSGGHLQMPVVLRVSVGNKYGAQHSQDWVTHCAHVPGLKVVFPATPYSAKGLMASALSGSDPVVFFESQRLYDQTEVIHPQGVPAEYYRIPLGEPAMIRKGRDLTIVTLGAPLYRAIEAADIFEDKYGITVEIIDAQCLVPLDLEAIYKSIKKTGKLILASDACERGAFVHTVASRITQMAFDYLDAPPCVIGARNWIVPPAELEDYYFATAEWFLDAYHTQIKRLPGYHPTTDRSLQAFLDGYSCFDVLG